MKGAAGILIVAFLAAVASAGELGKLGADGWYTWQVAAVDDAPAWCCYAWNHDGPGSAACRLDGSRSGYAVCRDGQTLDGNVRLYARIESGKATKLRVLSPGCPVESRTAVTDLGEIDVRESFDWLRGLAGSYSPVSEDALAAIAMHRGDVPLRFLVDTASRGGDEDLRENAIFWLGQVRISEASSDIERLMFADKSAAIRQHAAFSLAQSESSHRTDALIRQGRQDPDGEVRSQAWFWLAQTGAGEADQAIVQAIGDDPDRDVRKEAIFALTELPGERDVDALFVILGDRKMDRELRKQALFWLVQSESDRAFAYVDNLLAGPPR